MRVHELGINSFHDEAIDWVHPSRCHLKSGELVVNCRQIFIKSGEIVVISGK